MKHVKFYIWTLLGLTRGKYTYLSYVKYVPTVNTGFQKHILEIYVWSKWLWPVEVP